MCDIFVVGVNLDLVYVPHEVVLEFFKGVDNSKKFFIVDRVVKFGSY